MGKPKAKTTLSSQKASGARVGKGSQDEVKGVSKKSKKTFKKSPARFVKKIGGSNTSTKVEEKKGRESKGSDKKVKLSAAARREKRVFRKQQRADYELVHESKVIWEHLRVNKPSSGKVLAQEEIIALAKGHFRELALKHDTARVVQSCIKNGTKEHRSLVFSELKGDVVELSKLKYAKFVVRALLKYCTPAERGELISSLYGHVRKLIRHTEAGEVVEMAYNDYANAAQRTALIQEFYGSEFALFKNTPEDHTQDHTQPHQQTLGEVLEANPSRSKMILAHMRDSLLPLLDKDVVRHSIVHKALLDYLLYCSSEARAEMVEGLREKVVAILHTKDGSRVALQCIWHGTAKDRKLLVKSLKGVVVKVCSEENGHVVMMGLFDCVDDTVLLKKVILAELKEHLMEVCENQYGRRVLLYLLSPRSPRHFSPQFLSLLTPGDDNIHTKKPAHLRRKELLEGVASDLLTFGSDHIVEWVQSASHAPLLVEMAASLPGDLSPLYHPLLELLSQQEGGALIEHACGHWVMKKLIAVDSQRRTDTGAVSGFGAQLVSAVRSEVIRTWVSSCNRGAFLVSALLKVKGHVSDTVAKILAPLLPTLRESSLKGHQAILSELNQLEDSS